MAAWFCGACEKKPRLRRALRKKRGDWRENLYLLSEFINSLGQNIGRNVDVEHLPVTPQAERMDRPHCQ